MRLQHWVLFAVVVIVLMGAVERTHYLSTPLATDESRTVIEFASKPLTQALTDFSSTNNQFFNTILVHEALSLFGLQRWTIRLPSYFAGILLVAAAFAVGRRFYNAYAGLLAAALTASATWIVGYSVNARGYVLITLIFLLLLLVASSLLRRRRLRLWLVFAVLSIVGLYTILSAAYAIGLVFVWLGLSVLIEKSGRDRVYWLRDLAGVAILIGLVTAALYFPAWRYTQVHRDQELDIDSFTHVDRLDAIKLYANVGQEFWDDIHRPWNGLAGLMLLGVVISVALHKRISRYRVGLMAALMLWIPPALLIPSLTTYARVWIFLQPLYFIFAGAGLIYLGRRFAPAIFARQRLTWVVSLLVALLLAVIALPSDPETSGYPEAQAVVQQIAADRMTGDYILCDWFCPSLVLEGQLGHVPLFDAVTHNESPAQPASFTLAPGKRLYLVTRDVNPVSREIMNVMLRKLGIPADALKDMDVVADLSNMMVYRLTFNRAIAAPEVPVTCSNCGQMVYSLEQSEGWW